MNLIEEVLRLDKEATAGPWKNGKPTDAVVREAQPANPHGDDVNVYYGGDLIAESISPTDKTLIIAYRTAAPKLARALKKAFDLLRSYRDRRTEFERITGESDHTVDRCENAMNICRQQRVDKILAEIEKELAA